MSSLSRVAGFRTIEINGTFYGLRRPDSMRPEELEVAIGAAMVFISH